MSPLVFTYTIIVAVLSINAEKSGKTAWRGSMQNVFAQPIADAPWARDYKTDISGEAIVHPYPPAAHLEDQKSVPVVDGTNP